MKVMAKTMPFFLFHGMSTKNAHTCMWGMGDPTYLPSVVAKVYLSFSAFIPTGQNKLISFKINSSHSVDHQTWCVLPMFCWAAMSSCYFFNKAVINCHCALLWRSPKLGEINSACQRAVLWCNKAKRLVVRKLLGGSICNTLTLFTPGFLPRDLKFLVKNKELV